MKNVIAAIFMFLFLLARISFAQSSTSAQAIEAILSDQDIRSELQKIELQITALLGDRRLTDEAARQMLTHSKAVIAEMLGQKIGTNTHKLVALAKWQRDQALAKHSIHDAGGEADAGQRFILENPMAGHEVYLTSVIYWILSEYVRTDGDGAGNPTLESYLQLYLDFRSLVEGGTGIPECLLLKAPAWMQARFPQLSDDQKRQILQDSNEARAERNLEPLPDEVPADPPTPQEQAAYEAAYQFIVANTPQP